MKKISKLLVAVIISTCVLAFMPGNNCMAMADLKDGGGGLKTTVGGAIDGLNVAGDVDVGGLQKVIGTLLNFLQIASGLVAVLMIAIVGFNYILATSSDMKKEMKEMKEKALPIIIGIVLVFGATSIAKFFIGVAA